MKAAIHHSTVRPGGDWSAAEVAAMLLPLLPGLGNRVVKELPCTYTMTPDENYVVGRLPGTAQVFVACGLSGHGFKLTPVLGEALADLAATGSTAYDLALFDPKRS